MTYWYEVWSDEGLSPPYLLIVEPTQSGVRVVDPCENGRTTFEASNYEDVTRWLLEDEYTRVTGRMPHDE